MRTAGAAGVLAVFLVFSGLPACLRAQAGSALSFASPIRLKASPRVPLWGRFGAPRSYGSHNGIDFAVPFRTPVFAARPGVVVEARSFDLLRDYGRGYGGLVIIKHRDGSQTWYAHLDRVIVIEGQRVGMKTLLGMSGGKGNGHSAGPHLHFMIMDRYGKAINPEAALSGPYLTRR